MAISCRLRACIQRAALAALLACCALGSAKAQAVRVEVPRAASDPRIPAIVQAEPVEEPPAYEMVVPLGEFFLLHFDSFGPIAQAATNRPDVISFLPAEGNAPANTIRALGRRLGLANVTLVGPDGLTQIVPVRIAPSAAYLTEVLQRQFPTADLRLTAAGERSILVEGTVDSAENIDPIIHVLQGFLGTDQVINAIRVRGVMQVQLEVCIARVNRAALRRLGINFLHAGDNYYVGSTTGGLIAPPTVNPALAAASVFTNPGAATAQAAGVLDGATNLFFGITDDNFALFGFIEALENNNLGKILASPTLVTLSGRPAEFLVGGRQPVPVPTAFGGTPGVAFENFGTHLTFVPVVLGSGKIRLEVRPEVSTVNTGAGAIDINNFVVPQFLSQFVHTTVEMHSGQTLALGGLSQTETIGEVTKVPFLGDIPVLGAAFRRTSYREEETEILVIVTPRLIGPIDPGTYCGTAPGQETRTPTDWELYAQGRLEVPTADGASCAVPGGCNLCQPPLQVAPPPGEPIGLSPGMQPSVLPPPAMPAPGVMPPAGVPSEKSVFQTSSLQSAPVPVGAGHVAGGAPVAAAPRLQISPELIARIGQPAEPKRWTERLAEFFLTREELPRTPGAAALKSSR